MRQHQFQILQMMITEICICEKCRWQKFTNNNKCFTQNSLPDDSKILLDIEEEEPILDFKKYVSATSKIIKNSEPRFSIGIYGEWGTGKTTLMKGILKEIENNLDTSVIWFNAWRYENEENHATIPLLKTIANKLEKNPHTKELGKKVRVAAWSVGKQLVSGIISQVVGANVEKMNEDYDRKMSVLGGVEQNSITMMALMQ